EQGSELHFEVISTPSRDTRDRMLGIVTVFRDVTDLRRAGKELEKNFYKLQQAEVQARRERDQLDLILENVGVPIVVCDVDSKFIHINQRAEALFQAGAEASKDVKAWTGSNTEIFGSFISKLTADFEAFNRTELDLTDPRTGQILVFNIIAGKICDEHGEV